MVINLIFSIFSVVLTKAIEKSDFQLSPSSPPSAFLAQYYSVQFRVIGLNNPSFSFKELPKFLQGSENGLLQGVPDNIGSFLFKVKFSSGNFSGEDDVILRVTSQLNQQQTNQPNSNFQVVYPNSSLTFLSGSAVKLTFQVRNGKNPYIWSITNLPPGMFADTKGNINGTFLQQGYYTVSVSVSDMTGKSTYNYFVFNIQPKNGNTSKLVQVPNRNTNKQQFNLTEIQTRKIQVIKAVFQNAQKVFKAQNETTICRQKVANSTLVLQLAYQQADRFENRTNDIEKIKTLASTVARRAQGILNSTKNQLQLSNTNYLNSQNQFYALSKKVKQSKNIFQQSTLRLNQSSESFIAAQNQSLMAALDLKILQSANQDAHDTYQKYFNDYSFAKKLVQDQQNTLISANFIVDLARTNLSLTKKANDEIFSSLKMVQNIYEKTNSILNSTLKLVQIFRNSIKDTASDLEISKYKLVLSMNSLFVAQAAKAQADKATAIVSMQTAQEKNVSSLVTDMFSGCDQEVYPSISGTAPIQQKNSNSFKLSSGNILIYGNCSSVDKNLAIGELVTFQGYLKQGNVHLLKLKRWNI